MWDRISIRAVVIAFLAMLGVDFVTSNALFVMMAGDALTPDMSDAARSELIDTIGNSGAFLLAWLFFGSASTVGGGYLVARLAKQFPYYNGLAIGIVGLVFGVFFLGRSPLWFDVISILITVPASIYGAHLAKQQMTAAEK